MPHMKNPHLILASASPQRKQILSSLGLTFDIQPSSIDERVHPEMNPKQRAIVLAREKAKDIASKNIGSTVIGCDTLVVSQSGDLLEKPADADEARRMLKLQSGKSSTVISALCIIDAKGNVHEGVSESNVMFKELSEEDIEWWIKTKLWKDRSGSFQIDGLGQLMIKHIEGDFTSIVGLPVFLFGQLMEETGQKLTL